MRSTKANRPHQLPIIFTYLGMEARPKAPPPPPPLLKPAILKCEHPPVHFYRYIYDTIGQPYFWVERRLCIDEKLKSFLSHAKIVLYELYLDGHPAGIVQEGFYHLRARDEDQISC